MFVTMTGSPDDQKKEAKRVAELKVIQESRRPTLLALAKKLKLKFKGTPPHTDLVAMIAKKKGLLHAA